LSLRFKAFSFVFHDLFSYLCPREKLYIMKTHTPTTRIFAFLFAFFLGLGTAHAYDFSKNYSGQTFYFNIIDATNHYVEITYPGSSSDSPWEGYTKPTGSITLPSSIIYNNVTYSVKWIGNSAFYDCSGLTGSLTIPNTVTEIGNKAFARCSGFNGTLTLGNSLTKIGYSAFYYCPGFTGALTIPNSVTTIGAQVFFYCSGFTGSLTIGSGVTAIGYGAFYNCNSFTSMTVIPATPPTLNENVFNGVPTDIPVYVPCAALEAYQAAAQWNSFTNYQGFGYDFSQTYQGQTFYFNITDATNHYVEITYPGCSPNSPWQGYTKPTGSITLPSSVTYDNVTYSVKKIGAHAFDGCRDLTGSLTIPNTVTEIGREAFNACTGFNGSLTLSNSLIAINYATFWNCYGFTGTLTIPGTVTTIANAAFQNCSGFTGSLAIPGSVVSIGNSAFNSCSGLTGMLTIGSSVTSIGPYAFKSCSQLSSIKLFPETPPTLDTNPFQNVPTDIPVYVPCGSLYDYRASGWSDFTNMQRIDNNCDLLTYSINADGVSVTVTGHVDGTAATGPLTIPETTTIDGVTYTVTAIGDHAFEGCQGLTGSLVIPNTVTSIGYEAFYRCTGFTGSLFLSTSLTTIDTYAFYQCSNLSGTLTIPNSVTTLSIYAFCLCSGFTGVTIGSSVASMGYGALYGCTNLSFMTVLPETPPVLGSNVFYNVPTDIPVYVPCGSLEDYQSDTDWSAFTNIQCRETVTMFDRTATNQRIPAYIYYFDDFTKSQFVIPADSLVEMRGTSISSMTFYTSSYNIPYTTVSSANVYLMEVDYTTISAFETVSSTPVYIGYFSIVSAGEGGEMTINFSTPYTYNGGNLLVDIENTQDFGYKNIYFYGQTVSGSSISGYNGSSTGTILPTQQNFIPKTTFGFQPTCVPKSLPYSYSFEDEGEFSCWTMLNCDSRTGRVDYDDEAGNVFQFYWNYYPPQYLVSPKFEGNTAMGVSFSYKNADNTYPETFQVGYSTTTKSPSAFTWGEEVTAEDQYNWMLYEDVFPEGTKYVAIKLNSYDKFKLYLDDFSFEPYFCPLEDQCELTFALTDSYGDSWSGNAIRVVDVESNILLAVMTNITDDHANAPITETYTLPVCNGRELRFEWVTGSWSSECSYSVTDSNGNEIFSGSGAMSEPITYTVNCNTSQSQTIAFSAGTNWTSFNVDVTLDDLKTALVDALSGTGTIAITIQAKSQNTKYTGGRWRGSLNFDVTQMYMIDVSAACEITLEGASINSSEHPVTIVNGANWIAYPLDVSMTQDQAFAGFNVVNGDVISAKGGNARYTGGRWRGTVTLTPGQGYIYTSAASGNRTLVFPSGSK
jgi:hypothetical protein